MKNRWNQLQGLMVVVQHGDLERALRRLKKKMQTEGVFQSLRDHESYQKPSDRRRRARAAGRARALKQQQRAAEQQWHKPSF